MSTFAIVRLVQRYPQLGYGIGGATLVGAGVLGAHAHSEASALMDRPVAAVLADLPPSLPKPGRWVELVDTRWDCAKTIHDVPRNRLYVSGTDARATRAVVASFEDGVSCEDMTKQPVTGVVRDIWPAFHDHVRDLSLAIPSGAAGASVLEVCTSCTPSNAQLGYVVAGCFALLGLAMFPLTQATLRKRKREAPATLT